LGAARVWPKVGLEREQAYKSRHDVLLMQIAPRVLFVPLSCAAFYLPATQRNGLSFLGRNSTAAAVIMYHRMPACVTPQKYPSARDAFITARLHFFARWQYYPSGRLAREHKVYQPRALKLLG